MSRIYPSLPGLLAGAVLFVFPAFLSAGESPDSSDTPPQMIRSPIENFRKMLKMTVAERDQFLTNYPAEKREQIAEKVEEYQMLPEPFRELRLRTTELRWYLLPLLNMPATNRDEQLKRVPEPYQKLVAARVEEWKLWPPTLQQDLLEYARTKVPLDTMTSRQREELEQKLARWQALPPSQRQQLFAAFEHYFELNDEEKDKTLKALSEPEREETEKVLDPIEKWPKSQQDKYMAAFKRFGNMSAQEREQFLKNAERWKHMSEAERQAWRDLMKLIPPDHPPGRQAVSPGVPAPEKTNPTAGPLK
jgi:hypothetical protein